MIDGEIVEELINQPGKTGHKIDVGIVEDGLSLQKTCLRSEYETCLKSCTIETASYLPKCVFSSLGIFAKRDLPKVIFIEGLTGCLSSIEAEDIVPGRNNFSLIESNVLKKQCLMLGPISFVNHSCKSNARYKRDGFIMRCFTQCELFEGSEILVLYDRNYFGIFNEFCCCPHKTLHRNPCPPSPEPRKQKKRKAVDNPEPETSTPKHKTIKLFDRLNLKEKSTRFSNTDLFPDFSSDDSDYEYVDYEKVYGNFDKNVVCTQIQSQTALECIQIPLGKVSVNENIIENNNITENHLIVHSPPPNISLIEACNNAAEISLISPPNHMSTPIQLPVNLSIRF